MPHIEILDTSLVESPKTSQPNPMQRKNNGLALLNNLVISKKNGFGCCQNGLHRSIDDDDVVFVSETPAPRISVSHTLLKDSLLKVISVPNDLSNKGVTPDGYLQKATCAICMEDPFLNKPVSTKCGHVFCSACLLRSLADRPKCPMCNRLLRKTDYYLLFV